METSYTAIAGRHIEHGFRLKRARFWLMRQLVRLPTGSAEAQICRRRLAWVEGLRHRLDGELFRLIPRRHDPRDLMACVYYGRPLKQAPTETSNDAFEGWVVDMAFEWPQQPAHRGLSPRMLPYPRRTG